MAIASRSSCALYATSMSVQIALPTSLVANHQNLHRKKSPNGKPKARSLSASTSTAFAAAASGLSSRVSVTLNLHQRRRRASILELLPPPPPPPLQAATMLSEHPSKISGVAAATATAAATVPGETSGKSYWVGKREGLKLSFNRSISEPLGQHGLNAPMMASPPSVSPSLHPSKRCRMETMAPPQAAPTLPVGPAQQPEPEALSHPTSRSSGIDHAQPRNGALLRPPPNTVSLPNSPCSESSTLQRTILLQNARTVEPNALAAQLEMCASAERRRGHVTAAGYGGGAWGSEVLIVDCRPFIAYNVNHIRGAINVNCCDRFNRKRLQQGKATLADLATTKVGKETLKRRNWTEVVVYDDCSESLEKLPVSHTLFLVMNALVEDHRRPVMLLGGLRHFEVGHRRLCQDHLMKGCAGRAARAPLEPTAQTSTATPQSSHHLFPDLPSPTELRDTKDIENHPTSQVLPFLFLGNMRDASDANELRRLGIKFVLNVTAKPPMYPPEPDIVYKQLEAADNGVQNLKQFFEEAFEFIDRAKASSNGILIHCQAGVSRSPTIAVAYLMKHYPMAMSEAYKFVKR